MGKTRLEAFSDGVLAVIITILVLEIRAPHEPTLEALLELWPAFVSYLLSFVFIGIYWNNHHHMLHLVKTVTGGILWANSHLLFWLSLIPFAAAWMGENHFDTIPVALYGVVMFMAGIAYPLLQTVIIRAQGPGSTLKQAVGQDIKGKSSGALIALGVILTLIIHPYVGCALYALVAAMWLVPDTRLESFIARHAAEEEPETD